MPDPYVKTAAVISGITDALAQQYNSMMAEVKAACEGISTHDVDIVIAYAGGSGNDLPSTITITDNSPAGDAGFDITCVGTITYDADDLPTTVAWVFNAGEMNITVTEVITYTAGVPTAVARTIT